MPNPNSSILIADSKLAPACPPPPRPKDAIPGIMNKNKQTGSCW